MTQPSARVAIVEDNDLVRQELDQLLREHGFEVQLAENRQEAIQLLGRPLPPHVVFLDMDLPLLDGSHLLEEFRQLDVSPKPWIVVATGSPAITRRWAADHGCAGFLRKPFQPKQVLAELQRCLSETIECEVAFR